MLLDIVKIGNGIYQIQLVNFSPSTLCRWRFDFASPLEGLVLPNFEARVSCCLLFVLIIIIIIVIEEIGGAVWIPLFEFFVIRLAQF